MKWQDTAKILQQECDIRAVNSYLRLWTYYLRYSIHSIHSALEVLAMMHYMNWHLSLSLSLFLSLSLSPYLSLRFNVHFSRWTCVIQYQNVSILDFIEAKDGGDGSDNWMMHSSGQIVITSKPIHNFLQAGCLSCRPTLTDSVKALKGKYELHLTCTSSALRASSS